MLVRGWPAIVDSKLDRERLSRNLPLGRVLMDSGDNTPQTKLIHRVGHGARVKST
jgi:hypothetical protein